MIQDIFIENKYEVKYQSPALEKWYEGVQKLMENLHQEGHKAARLDGRNRVEYEDILRILQMRGIKL